MATKKKALKKSKLRHAEYYGFQEIQDRLYAESMDGKVFTKLVEIITLPENIKSAYRNIKKNKGSKTAGTDGKTIQHLEKLSEEKLVAFVQRKISWYVPQSVRRVEIPKDNGKTRPLGIPTIMDRLVQQCVLQVLEPICEAKFHDHSYGFRPNRSQQHAISQVHKNMQLSHLHYVVDIDIKGFFDNVNHGKLLKQLWTLGIRDKKLISIISAMLKAEVAGIGFPEKGTPQGGIISPLLSNIVLNELDWWLASQWENIPTQYPFKQTPNRNGSPNHGNKYASLRRSGLKEITCVRYADDFKIFTSSYSNAVKLFHATKDWLKERLGLDISPEKSRVINLKEDYSEFLGFKLKLIPRGKTKQGQAKFVVESHVREKSIKKIKDNLEGLKADIATAKKNLPADPEHFRMTIGGIEYTDRKEAGTAIIAACAGLKAVNTGGVIGEYAGFTLRAQFDSFSQQYKLSIKGKTTHTMEVGPDPAGNITRINNVVTGLGKNLEKAEQQLQSLHEKVESAKAEIMRPFPQEEELAAKLARLREVNAMLDMDDKGTDTVPAQEGATVAADRANSTPIARVAISAAAQATCADQPRRTSVLDRLKANQAVVAAQAKPSAIPSHKK